jgi:hypothetical protein
MKLDIITAMKRSGVADLPLHGGRVPLWLAERMTRLGTAITGKTPVNAHFSDKVPPPPFDFYVGFS